MHFSLQVVGFENSKSKMIVARMLTASNSSLTYQKALSMLEQLPLVVFDDVDEEGIKEHIMQFNKIGVRFKILPATAAPTVKPDTPAPPILPIPKKPLIIVSHLGHLSGGMGGGKIDDEDNVNVKKTVLWGLSRLHFGLFTVLIVYIIIMALVFKFRKPGPPTLHENLPGMNTPVSSVEEQPKEEQPVKQPEKKHETAVDLGRVKAGILIDSARQYTSSDPQKAINFYKMAIGFNKNNINAWFGLVNAYHDASMNKEASEAEEQMKAIFGDQIFSVDRIVNPYGEVLDASRGTDGVYRIEYGTKVVGKELLTQETFLIVKALRASCGCKAITLYAQTDPGKGMLVSVSASVPLTTLEDFTSAARINYME